MNGLPYYKSYPRDFFEGTIGMPLEMKGPYRLVIDLIYMQGGKLPDDARYISGLLGCSVKLWNKIREYLLTEEKIESRDGFLGNLRADVELESLAKLQQRQSENRSRPNKNKDLQTPRSNHTEPEPDIRDTSTNVDVPIRPFCDASEAVAEYNAVASRAGWPQVQKMTDARRRAIRARFGECGGIEGWRTVLGKAEASDFLCARTDRPWSGFGFDWLTAPKNFTKIMEGNYDNRAGNSRPSPRPENRPDPALEQIARLAGLGQASGHGGR